MPRGPIVTRVSSVRPDFKPRTGVGRWGYQQLNFSRRSKARWSECRGSRFRDVNLRGIFLDREFSN
jgi:hypothetical protein